MSEETREELETLLREMNAAMASMSGYYKGERLAGANSGMRIAMRLVQSRLETE